MNPPMLTLSVTVDGRWQPGIGDPSLLGWITVVAYAAASLACYLASRRNHAARSWLVFGAVLALMTVNKALDLQSWFTHAGRGVARHQGWYTSHGYAQAAAIAAVVLTAFAVAAGACRRLTRRGTGPLSRLAAGALIYQVAFVVVRSISMHAFDRLLGVKAGPLRLNHVFELAGLVVVIAAATGSGMTPRARPTEQDRT